LILCIVTVTNHLYTVISFVILPILPSELKAINYPPESFPGHVRRGISFYHLIWEYEAS